MKNNMKDLTLAETIASIMVFSYGFREFLRGFFWFKEQDDVLDDSSFYLALHHIMPIWSWGIVVMFAGLIVMISSIFLASSDQNTKFSKLITFGGFLSAILYFFDDQCKYLSLNQLANHRTYGANVSNRFCCVLCWRC
ncbi:hypothetical protein ACUW81_001463 [Staphylococcus borealis]